MIAAVILGAIAFAVIGGAFAHDRDHHPEHYTVTEVKSGLKSAAYPVLFFFFILVLILIRTGFFERHF